MKFTKSGRAEASKLALALELYIWRQSAQRNSYSEADIQDSVFCQVAWVATGHNLNVGPGDREEGDLQIFVAEHRQEVAALASICDQKIRAYMAAGGNPKSSDLSEIIRQALACLEDEGEMYDTGERVASRVNGELIPVYKLIPKRKN